jgi:hypothetical protein
MFGTGKHANVRCFRPSLAARIAAIMAVTGAGLLGAAILLSGVDSSRAEAPGATFSERFSLVSKPSDCPSDGWPYFKAECLRMPDGSRARPVRVIGIDRPAFTGVVVAAR